MSKILRNYLNVGEMRHSEMSGDVIGFGGQGLLVPMATILQIPVLDVSFAQHVVEALRGVMRWPLGHGDVVQAYRFLSIPRGTNIDMV